MSKLAGKAALVTGGSRGIGAAIAKRLADDGTAVAITYSSSPDHANAVVKEITSKGGRAISIKADAADMQASVAAVREAARQLGGLDILVNNAAILQLAPIADFNDDAFEKSININVRSVFYTVREAARLLRDSARIIMIGSVNSDAMPFAGGSVYALTKGAIAAFTRGLARDLAPRGITVNNIQPGPINTDLNPESADFAGTLKGLMAIKRYGRVDEVGAMVSYLVSDDAAFVTGAGLKIDGGFDA